jgi:hypothetical protein
MLTAVERKDYMLVNALVIHGGPPALALSDLSGRTPLDLTGQ